MQILIWIIYFFAAIYGAFFFVEGMGWSYFGLSIGMAPILWGLMLAGIIVGLICTIKNAINAYVAVKNEKRKNSV